MTESTPNPFAAVAKKPGRPKTAVAPAAAPSAPSSQRAAPKPSLLSKMKARPNWDDDTAVMVGDEGVDRLRIPPELVAQFAADGVALQWITKSVRGMETPQEMAKFVKGGWTPIHQSDFDGVLDGIFLPKGQDEIITVDDCMLVARPMEVHLRSKQRERAQAREPLRIKEAEIGAGLPVSGGDHPSARSQNRVNKTVERIEIPE